jgi:PPM family protein phosphatase
MKIRTAVRSDVGRVRDHNEDVGLTARAGDPRCGVVLCVADGMGGHPAGDDASRLVADHVGRYPELAANVLAKEAEDLDAALVQVLWDLVGEASAAILEIGREDADKQGLGTTAVTALVIGDQCHVFHCGDSRAYRLRGEMLEQLTADHVVVEGGTRFLALHLGMPEGTVLDRGAHGVAIGDRLLLCSDGLTDMVPPETFGLLLHEAGSPEQACEDLIAAAIEAGGVDNITCAVAFLEEGEAEPREKPQVVRTDRPAAEAAG